MTHNPDEPLVEYDRALTSLLKCGLLFIVGVITGLALAYWVWR